jgi:hypothetical protein
VNDFLNAFDRAIEEALESGDCGLVLQEPQEPVRVRSGGDLLFAVFFPVKARTMHPAFMAAKPRKYDPERDNG